MFVVGLTGGIGSGKTAVSDRFAARGIAVVDADVAARIVVEPGQPALVVITEHFGEDMLTTDGRLNRAALRARVFSDPAEREWLEALLHPRISECIAEQLAAASSAYAVLVSPLLFETNQVRFTDRVLVVDVPEELQLERTMARDNNDEAQVRAIMAAQASREDRLDKADDVIVNDAGLESLDARVEELHEHYLAAAGNAHE
jgi:dephospho-CoA kinase